eukprot:CAMPEP_0169399188 /NCGR_PEP_ID=MMETSP1017-20121227/53067_1 /TAXON_ID=342587 /ORGANISM="Karlodinium micrum, Strain CCMP2283" /LENGTH=55 /DNA_ID=CAMNT_0009504275 /DNA_START=136 /DNA_END=299 /DNA_ORIENTATION=-
MDGDEIPLGLAFCTQYDPWACRSHTSINIGLGNYTTILTHLQPPFNCTTTSTAMA